MTQTIGAARFAGLKLETRRITLIADALFADFKTKKIRKKIRKRFKMNAELFKAIALIGLAVFLNCLILVCFDLVFMAFFMDDDDDEKEEIAERCLTLIAFVGVLALITALDGALIYSVLS